MSRRNEDEEIPEVNEDYKWSSSAKFVLEKLREHGVMLQSIQDKLVKMQLESNTLKVKFGLFVTIGIVAATVIPPIIGWAIAIVKWALKNPTVVDSIIK
jgi:hypothetical protein